MTGSPRAETAPRPVNHEHAPEPDVLGLAEPERDALLKTSETTEPLALMGDRKAAEAGDTDAMVNLAALLAERGEEDEAAQWYRKAADAGRLGGRQS